MNNKSPEGRPRGQNPGLWHGPGKMYDVVVNVDVYAVCSIATLTGKCMGFINWGSRAVHFNPRCARWNLHEGFFGGEICHF